MFRELTHVFGDVAPFPIGVTGRVLMFGRVVDISSEGALVFVQNFVFVEYSTKHFVDMFRIQI